MNPQAQDPLAQLRDIHLPDAVGFWPPAPGWWLLALIVLVVAGYGLYRWLRHRKLNHYRHLALRQLAVLEGQSLSPLETVQQLNILLKRTLIAAPEPPAAAGLSGERWLRFLDQSGHTSAFSNGPGQLLAEAPYRDQPLGAQQAEHIEPLQQLVQQWIKNHRFEELNTVC